jgi:hypothetical protein
MGNIQQLTFIFKLTIDSCLNFIEATKRICKSVRRLNQMDNASRLLLPYPLVLPQFIQINHKGICDDEASFRDLLQHAYDRGGFFFASDSCTGDSQWIEEEHTGEIRGQQSDLNIRKDHIHVALNLRLSQGGSSHVVEL